MRTRNSLSTIVLAGIFSAALLPFASARANDIPAIADLRADVQGDPQELLLRWSTPFFEVPEEGTKTEPSYDIRFGSSPLTESSWDTSSPVSGIPPGVVLYSHAVLTLSVGAYTRSDGYIYWDRVACHAELYWQVVPGLAKAISGEPIYFEVRRQSNGQLAALGGPVYTDTFGWADWHSDDLTDVSRESGGEWFTCWASWSGGSVCLGVGEVKYSDSLATSKPFHGEEDEGYPPPPEDWWSVWGGTFACELNDVNLSFFVPAGAIEMESAESNISVVYDVPPFVSKNAPVPGAMFAYNVSLGPDSVTTLTESIRCSADYPEYMLDQYGGLGESSLRAYRYDYDVMQWVLLEAELPVLDRDHHTIHFTTDRLGLFALAAETDGDGDGLGDFEEMEHGTDPGVPDFDGDGVNDGDEIWFTGGDPLDPLKKKGKDQHWTTDVPGRSGGLWIAARIVSGSHSSPISNPVYIGPPITPAYTESWNGTGIFEGDAAWGDFDGDGDPDLVICGESDGGLVTRTYENLGYTLQFRQDLEGIESTGSGCLAWGDYDGDGDLDLAMAGTTASTRIARIYGNDGSGNLTWDSAQVLTGVGSASAAWADFDRDGDTDLVLTGYDGAVRTAILYKNHPVGTLTPDPAQSLTGVNGGSADWADWDGDGDSDLVITGNDGTNRSTTFYVNDPVGTLTDDGDHGILGVTLSDTEWGDYDRDGDADLAITGETGPGGLRIARVYENDGDGNFTQAAQPLSIYRSSCAWGDIDLDGDLDLALCGYDGSGLYTYIYENTGSGFTVGSFWFPGIREGAVSLVDVDLDGDLDFFMAGADWSTKYARLYLNEGLLTAVAEDAESIAGVSGSPMLENFPNPFNPETTIRYRVCESGSVDLTIYSPTGRVVRELVTQTQNAGVYEVRWDGLDDAGTPVASGVYYYRLEAGDGAMTKKMVLLK